MTRPPDEHTPSGAPVFAHGPGRRSTSARQRPDTRAALRAHVERHLGPVARIHEDPEPELVHLDVLQVDPAPGRNYVGLVTAGASDRPAHPPPGAEELERVELFLGLPPDWPLDPRSLADPRHAWPFDLLRFLGRFPHRFSTWLAWGHTVPNGEPPRPYAPGTELLCAYLREPRLLEPEATRIELAPGKVAQLLAVVPIDAAELARKLELGAARFELSLREADVTELLDPERPSSVM